VNYKAYGNVLVLQNKSFLPSQGAGFLEPLAHSERAETKEHYMTNQKLYYIKREMEALQTAIQVMTKRLVYLAQYSEEKEEPEEKEQETKGEGA